MRRNRTKNKRKSKRKQTRRRNAGKRKTKEQLDSIDTELELISEIAKRTNYKDKLEDEYEIANDEFELANKEFRSAEDAWDKEVGLHNQLRSKMAKTEIIPATEVQHSNMGDIIKFTTKTGQTIDVKVPSKFDRRRDGSFPYRFRLPETEEQEAQIIEQGNIVDQKKKEMKEIAKLQDLETKAANKLALERKLKKVRREISKKNIELQAATIARERLNP